MKKLASPISYKNGYSIHRLYIPGAQGNFVPVGFGVFSPMALLLGAHTTLPEAEDALTQWTRPKSHLHSSSS